MRGKFKPKSHIQEVIYLEVTQLFAVKRFKYNKEEE